MSKGAFRENVVVLTGASSGIGTELAYQLASQGAWIALAARDAARLERVAERCRELGGRAIVVKTDVALKEDCRTLIERAAREFGRIDTLINNAGISMWSRFDELDDPSVIEPIMQINYFGGVYCTYYALPYLKKSRGRIVGVSSLTGKTGVPTRTGYAASKHAMAGFFDSLRIELTGSGVTVTMVYPGFVATEVRQRSLGADGKPIGKSPGYDSHDMTAETCARMILAAAAARKRELVMTAKGRLGLWFKLIAPNLVDRIALKTMNDISDKPHD